MEEKLAAYRRRKRQKEVLQNFKSKLMDLIPFTSEKEQKDACIIEPLPESSPSTNNLSEDAASDTFSDDYEEQNKIDNVDKTTSNGWLKYTLWLLYFLFWVTCYAIAIELKFGMVYLMISALIGIYLNTRTRPRQKDEMSPYSVFNEGCESIDGTLKAEQFEREIRYGSNSVR